MHFIQVKPDDDLKAVIKVLNESHGTVAEKFGFSKEDNPGNNAFIDEVKLKEQFNSGIELYALIDEGQWLGCVAIEQSKKDAQTYYIEKVSVIPQKMNSGFGLKLMNFATEKIREYGGKKISIALIDSHDKLKRWYSKQGFGETATKDFDHLPFRVCFMEKQVRVD